MNATKYLLAVSLPFLMSPLAMGQLPPPLVPGPGPSPVLYVRFGGIPGMKVTFYQGAPVGRAFNVPAGAGLRPGYLYRVKLTNLAGHPGLALYPTLEVRGTLQLPPRQRPSDYPAWIALSHDDIEHAKAGVLITKVIYLEDPDRAYPVATRPELPPEKEIRPGQDPVAEARSLGRPMLIVRLGGRTFTDAELAHEAIPGTVLLAGDKRLTAPAAGPWIPWACMPVIDPLLGPRPLVEECLHDGGDSGAPAGFDQNGNLRGLDPADTVAEYKDSRGERHITPSNRVCLCAPRFAVVRMETPIAGYETAVVVAGTKSVQEQGLMKSRQPSLFTKQNEQLAGMKGQERASANVANLSLGRLIHLDVLKAYEVDVEAAGVLGTAEVRRLTKEQITRLSRQMDFARLYSRPYGTRSTSQTEGGPLVVGRVEGTNVFSTVAETRDFTATCGEKPQPPDRPIILFKWASAQGAQIGDVVTFFLKYSNHGGRPINDIAVSDSLTGRLEYIPGSSKTDRDAVFTMQQNEAGSLILRWEIGGSLLPGQSGVVSFRARIR
jgi:uncharacterized repeat protein (TIGR01451 family)